MELNPNTAVYYDQLLAFIRQKTALSLAEFEEIKAVHHHRFVPKHTVMWRQGGTCNELGFLCKGLTRSYFLDEKGREVTRRLAVEDNLINAYGAYVFERPSEESIITEEDCHLLVISREDDMRLQQEMEAYRLYRIRIAEQMMIGALRFLDGFLANDASFRYRRMVKFSPEIFERVPLKHIASLIGVTPTQLSRIRAKWKADHR